MKLSKAIKSQLFESVMKDQFNDEIAAIESEIKIKANAFLLKADNGFSKTVMDLKKNTETTADVSGIQHFELYGNYSSEKEPYNVRSSFNGEIAISITRTLDLDRVFVCPYGRFETTDVIKHLKPEIEAAKQFIKNAEQVAEDLHNVLLAANTVEQLKKLTDIFNPFIPKPTVKKLMIPLQSIEALKKLKSPKGSKS